MQDINARNFGFLIAYLLPGFVTLYGLRYLSPTVDAWLGVATAAAPTVGGFLYVTMGSIGIGMTVSTLRWLLIDQLHHLTGVPRSRWDVAKLPENLATYDVLTQNHYLYYQHNANLLIALPLAYLCWRIGEGFGRIPFGMPEFVLVVLIVILFLGSRDTFAKYHNRLNRLMSQ